MNLVGLRRENRHFYETNSIRAVLAHEYYGHAANRFTKWPIAPPESSTKGMANRRERIDSYRK